MENLNELSEAKETTDEKGKDTKDPRPNEKYPKSKLPKSGDHPYIPKKEKGSPEIVNNPQGKGYVDRDGNIWEWDGTNQHWDVQHPNGTHTNIRPDGKIHHGPNNF